MAFAQCSIKDGGCFRNLDNIYYEFNFDKSEHPIYPEFSSKEELDMFAKCNAIIYVNDCLAPKGVSTRHAIVKKTVVYFLTNDWNHDTYFDKMPIKGYKEFHY
jgi:hypothetical protein